MDQTVSFKFSVAGICLEVHCCFPSTYAYCQDFLVYEDVAVQDTIHITAIDLNTERELLLSKKDAGERLRTSTPEGLEILVLCRKTAEILPKYGAVLFHGSALAFDGQGVLITATSGTGKSTHSSIWRSVFPDRVTMINDDKPFLKLCGDQVFVCGSPWMGKHRIGKNICVPLHAICILNRSTCNNIHPISAREAIPLLIQQTYRPESAEALIYSLQTLDGVSSKIGLYKIFCNMDDAAATVVCNKIFS